MPRRQAKNHPPHLFAGRRVWLRCFGRSALDCSILCELFCFGCCFVVAAAPQLLHCAIVDILSLFLCRSPCTVYLTIPLTLWLCLVPLCLSVFLPPPLSLSLPPPLPLAICLPPFLPDPLSFAFSLPISAFFAWPVSPPPPFSPHPLSPNRTCSNSASLGRAVRPCGGLETRSSPRPKR